MSNSKYTPGPWTFRETGSSDNYAIECNLSYRKHNSQEERVATVTTLNKSNMHLIVTAPEMLEALEKVIRQLPEELTLDGEIFRDELKSLIKKAKGE